MAVAKALHCLQLRCNNLITHQKASSGAVACCLLALGGPGATTFSCIWSLIAEQYWRDLHERKLPVWSWEHLLCLLYCWGVEGVRVVHVWGSNVAGKWVKDGAG